MIETFGSRLKKLVGVNKTAIHYYENDMRQPPYETLIRLASIFNVTTDYLLGCEKKNVIDVSGLTTAEMSLIRSLVDNMVQKNMRLEGRIYMIGGQDD